MEEIVFKNVTKYFHENIALEEVSFEIEHGEFVFVTGKSGAGKSTLLKLISKLEDVTSGEIIIDGKKLQEMPARQLPYYRRNIGYMSKDIGLVKDISVYDNLMIVMNVLGKGKRQSQKDISHVLGIVGLANKKDACAQELSGGEESRILLARALLVQPKILIADEPTANLDADAAWDLMMLLNELNHNGLTVIAASHATELVSIMKKRVFTLVAGCLVADEKCAVYNQKAMDIFEERKILQSREKKQKKH